MYLRPKINLDLAGSLLALIFFILVNSSQAQSIDSQIDSILNLASTEPEKALKAITTKLDHSIASNTNNRIQYKYLMCRGEIFTDLIAYDQAIEMFNKAQTIAEHMKDQRLLLNTHLNVGQIKYNAGFYIKSKYNYEEALRLALKLGLKLEESQALYRLGLINLQRGQLASSIDFLKQSLPIKEFLKDSVGMSLIYNTLGVVNYQVNNDETAVKYLMNSIRLKAQLNDIPGLCNSIMHLGEIHLKHGNLDSALHYYELGLDTINLVHHPKLKSMAIGNIGAVYMRKGDYVESKKYMTQAMRMKEEVGDQRRIAAGMIDFGDLYMKLNQHDSALYCYQRGAKIADELDMRDKKLLAFAKMAKLYDVIDQDQKSIEFYKQYISLNDSVYGLSAQEQINEFQVEYETHKKQARIEILEQEREINELKRAQTKNLLTYLIVISSLLFTTAALLYSRYRLKLRTAQELEEKNIVLRELNATKDKFYSVVAHDIRNPLNAFHHITESLHTNFAEFDANEKQNILEQLKVSAAKLMSLFENLLGWVKSQSSQIKPKITEIDSSVLIASVVNHVYEFACMKDINVLFTQEESCVLFSDSNMIRTILRNLVVNAIKFSYPNGKVELSVRQEKSTTLFSVKDYGKGIDPKDQKSLFKLSSELSAETSDLEGKGSGLGLMICKEFASMLEGRIEINSKLGMGTEVIVYIPTNATV